MNLLHVGCECNPYIVHVLSVTIFRYCLPGAPKVLTPLVKIIHKVQKEIDFYYRPQTKFCEGYIFTPVCQSFCSQRGRGYGEPACVVAGGGCMVGGVWLWGVCMVVGGCAWLWGGGHAWDTTRYSQWAAGTHPNGMHSCYLFIQFVLQISVRNNCVMKN